MSTSTCREGPAAARNSGTARIVGTAVGGDHWDDVTMSKIIARVDDIRSVVRHELHARGVCASTEQLAAVIATVLLDAPPADAELATHAHGPSGTEALTPVLEFIETHLSDNLSLEKLAAVAAFSPFHFARVFRSAAGMSPHQYIIGRRVQRARVLLLTTNWTLAAIGREVGFASGSHLALHFKKVTGESPSHYRSRGVAEESA